MTLDRLDNINVARIRTCAELYDTSLPELFADLDIAESTRKSVEENGGGLTYTQLSKIANYLNRGVLYFMESGNVDKTSLRSTQFRSLENQKPEISRKVRIIIENIESYREIYISLKEDIDDQAVPFAPTQMPTTAEDAADAAREWLKIKKENSFEITRTAVENAGILVFRSNGYAGAWQIPPDDDVLGFSLYFTVLPVIFVRKQENEARQLFTLAHELGHLLLHKNHFIDGQREFDSSNNIEIEANKFAGHFLVPTENLDEIDDRIKPADFRGYSRWLRKYVNRWGVSAEMILRRLYDEGRLQESDYMNYRSWQSQQPKNEGSGGSRQYRYREPKHLFGEGFVSAVLQSLREEKISLVTASQYLDNLKAEDVRKLETYYEGS